MMPNSNARDDDPTVTAVAAVCEALSHGDEETAAELAAAELPFEGIAATKRAFSTTDAMKVFRRDRFRDRYFGTKLLFPGTLRLLSFLLPEQVPFHKNWKMSECHELYWTRFPTVDHVVPVARGGADAEHNWVTTSQRANSAKSNWTLEELEWSLVDVDDDDAWDGLLGWFMHYVDADPTVLTDAYLRRWHRAALATT